MVIRDCPAQRLARVTMAASVVLACLGSTKEDVVVKDGIYSVKKQGASYEHTPVWTRAPVPIIAAAGTSLVVEDPKAVP